LWPSVPPSQVTRDAICSLDRRPQKQFIRGHQAELPAAGASLSKFPKAHSDATTRAYHDKLH
jgi:hypothetical protein